jgi:hypothetical protein
MAAREGGSGAAPPPEIYKGNKENISLNVLNVLLKILNLLIYLFNVNNIHLSYAKLVVIQLYQR